MRSPKLSILTAAVAMALASAFAPADDGELLRKNLSNTPDYETEFAGIEMLRFYVPAQASNGEAATIVYNAYDGTTALPDRTEAKPLIAVYVDGHVDGYVGQRDAWGAVSFDDGNTWSKTNLSKSGTKAIKVATGGKPIKSYGDVFRMYHASAGNKVLAVWASRYCDQGDPAYNLADGTTLDPLTGELYVDLFGVTGAQGYVDYTAEYPDVGKVPYGCVWTARGTLETDAVGQSVLLWRQAERLTSGKRDAHRIEISCADDAGCAVTWQEDPEGLRTGDGDGPGEGWSGAVANKGTDVWYSWIDWANFDLMDINADGVADDAAKVLATGGAPKVLTHMSIPVRLTDNEKCVPLAEGEVATDYCHVLLDSDADGEAELDLCTDQITYTSSDGSTVTACIAEDGRVLNGQTAATRARIQLQPYTVTTTDEGVTTTTTSAWAIVQYEENKALGELDLNADGEADEIGKNNRYMSFEFKKPEVIRQGLQLNSPAVAMEYVNDPTNVLAFTDWNETSLLLVDAPLYDTEIARRASLITQSPAKIAASVSKTSATPLFKQGVIKSGGPADIMMRRFVAPAPDDPTQNPYDEKNLVCSNWLFTDGLNPNYLDGLCIEPAMNLSAVVPTLCDGVDCGYQTTNPTLTTDDGENILVPDVQEWAQYPGFSDATSGMRVIEPTDFDGTNLNDQSWENALDVAKGHRGFLDGDFLMVLYAWSPNWKTNSIGHDQYNLYVRRSFDGGQTWTTTPASFDGVDPDGGDGPAPAVVANGTTTCELFRSDMDSPVCFEYAAGENEQARNVSLLASIQTTILDPRYSPTPASITSRLVDGVVTDTGAALYEDDIRDPSRFFVVYETGDNYLVSLGAEALPLDLFYSQAVNYGDDYTGYLRDDDPVGELGTVGVTPLYAMPQFDALEGNMDLLSGEASLKATPSGMFLHATWNQWLEDLDTEVISNSDAWYRRVLFLDNIENPEPTGAGSDGDTGGGGGDTKPGKGRK